MLRSLLNNAPLLALIGTIIGTIGLKIVESVLTRGKTRSDIAAELRKELREDVQGLRDEIRRVENESDAWRAKYYVTREEVVEIKYKMYELQASFDSYKALHAETCREPRL